MISQMQRKSNLFLFIAWAVASLGVLSHCQAVMHFGVIEPREDNNGASAISNVRVGFGGVYRLGHWAPVQFDFPQNDSLAKIEITTVDGDGGNVIYRQSPLRTSDTTLEAVIRIGRKSAFLKIRLLDEDDKTIADLALTQNELSEISQPVPATDAIELVIGEAWLATSVLKKDLTGDGGSTAVFLPEDIASLPTNAKCYDSVERILLTTRDDRIIDSLSQAQLSAIGSWMGNGGKLIVSAGKNGSTLFGTEGPFSNSVKLQIDGTARLTNTADLEHFATPASQLVNEESGALLISKCIPGDGIVVLDAERFPLIVKQAVGFGQITIFAFDIDDPLIRNWDGTSKLFSKSQFADVTENRDEEKKTNDQRFSRWFR